MSWQHSTYKIIGPATICWCMYCILSWYLFPIIFVYYSTLLNILSCTHVEIGGLSNALYNAPVLGRQSTLARLPISRCIHTISSGWPLSIDVCIACLLDVYYISFSCTILPYSIYCSAHVWTLAACPMPFTLLMYLGGGVCQPGCPSANVWNKKESMCQPTSARVRIM